MCIRDRCWNTTNPDRGYKNRLVVYMTAKKGCDGCSGAYIENVSIALKDTKAPTISSIKITSAANSDSETTYFKAGQTLYAKVKFSEYVRLADNKNSSKQSTNIKLGLSLAKKNTKNATHIQAKLVSLKTVSYTHLDVYKRQDRNRNKRCKHYESNTDKVFG